MASLRLAPERVRMNEGTAPAVGLMELVLTATAQAEKVRATEVLTIRAAGTKIRSFLLLLLLVRIVHALTPANMLGLTVAVREIAGESLVSAAAVTKRRAARVRTTRVASTEVYPLLVLSLMMSLGIALERGEMDGVTAVAVESIGLVLRSAT